MTGFRGSVALISFLVLFGVVGHDEVSWHQLTLALAALATLFWATKDLENG